MIQDKVTASIVGIDLGTGYVIGWMKNNRGKRGVDHGRTQSTRIHYIH